MTPARGRTRVPGRIMLTGASGFVGGHLVPALRGAYPAAVILATAAHSDGAVRALDITRDDDVRAMVREFRPDAFVHLAAISAIGEAARDPGLAMRVNVDATTGIAAALLAHAPDCVLLFASSADVYGAAFAAARAMTEADAPRPMNAYAASKASAEMVLSYLAHDRGLRCVIARPTNHTGPGQRTGFVVPDFCAAIRHAQATNGPVRTGRLDPLRDFLDVRDVCAAYAAMLSADLEPGCVLNLSSGVARPVQDVLDALLRLTGATDLTVQPDPGRVRRVDIPRADVSAALARRALGWEPVIPWSRTLSETLAGFPASG